MGWLAGIVILIVVMVIHLPTIRGQMDMYNQQYDAHVAYCQSGGNYGVPNDCRYGTRNQNWFGNYHLGNSNPYGFVSTMPYGYGSGAQPFYSGYAGGWPGTSLAPGGYYASALPQNSFIPNNPYQRY